MMVMPEFLTALIDFISRDQALVQIMVTLSILVFGHLGVKIVKFAGRKTWVLNREDVTKKQVAKRQEIIKYTGYLLDAAVILVALVYLDAGITQDMSEQLATFLPQVLSAALIVLLGIIIIQLITRLGENFLRRVGMQKYLKEIGFSVGAVNIISGALKVFLYVILLQITLAELGIGDGFINELIFASSWAAAFLVAALVFYSSKDLLVNLAAGIYLKNSENVRPGEEVTIDGEKAEIRNVSLFSTSLDTKTGHTVISPNKEIADLNLKFKRSKNDLGTLEEITSYFVAQNSEYTVAASIEMALEIFGYRKSQKSLMESIEEANPETIIDSIEDTTNNEVRAAFVEEEKMTDTSGEFKTWFNDGALVLPKVDRSEIFSEEEDISYILSVAVEEDELLMIDPSPERGGVYFVGREKLHKAMTKTDESGYIVLAPEGTTAHWRIKNELIYSDKTYYDELSKTLESRLVKIMRQGRLLKDSMPSSVDKYLDKWRENREVTRLWSPED